MQNKKKWLHNLQTLTEELLAVSLFGTLDDATGTDYELMTENGQGLLDGFASFSLSMVTKRCLRRTIIAQK